MKTLTKINRRLNQPLSRVLSGNWYLTLGLLTVLVILMLTPFFTGLLAAFSVYLIGELIVGFLTRNKEKDYPEK
jgi:uncharacterized membrane protein